MAYGILYYHEFVNSNGKTERIDILEKDYAGGSTLITHSGGDPVILKHTGERDTFDTDVIQGQELLFTFISKTADADKYDTIFESEYKDYQIKYYVDSSLKFIGWIKPENLTRQYFHDQYFITLSANDALADLKDIDFRDSDDYTITGKVTKLQILKYALGKTGIELDFKIQLGTYEINYMTSSQCALDKISVDARRFIDDNGSPMNCRAVIEEILKIYNVKLKQHNGYYQLTNYHEKNSYEFEFDWATLTQQSRTATDNIVDLAGYKYKFNSDLIKIGPLKKVSITYKNKDLGIDTTSLDLADWDDPGVWTIDFSNGYDKSGELVVLHSDDNTYDDYIETAQFAVTKITDDDYLKITFDHAILDSDAIDAPVVHVTITKPYPHTYDTYFTLREFMQAYESPITAAFKIDESGNYKVRFSFKQIEDDKKWTTAHILMKNMAITYVINANELANETVTYDKLIEQTSDKGFINLELETILFDGSHTQEVSALLFNNTGTYELTSSWNSYGYTENIKLADIFCRNILNNRQSYKNYLRLTIFDPDDTLDFNSILYIKSKYYTFISYERESKPGIITAELMELVTDRLTYNLIYYGNITSINGHPASSSGSGNTLISQIYTIVENNSGDYYTKTELNAGQLNNIYYTETEVNNLLAEKAPLASPTFTGTLGADVITASGIITGKAFRSTNSNDLNLLIRSGGNNALYIQQVDATGEIASFRYGGATAGSGTEVMAVDHDNVAVKVPLIISNGGTIGQAAGPLLTFDDSNDYLEITGCKVGIGTTTPYYTLQVEGDTRIQATSANPLIVAYTPDNSAIGKFEIWSQDTEFHININEGGDAAAGHGELIFTMDGATGQAVNRGGYKFLDGEDATMFHLDNYDKRAYFGGNVGINGGLHVGGTSAAGDNNLWVDGISQHPDWVTGWFGNNWRIAENGDIEVENLLVRASARFRELIIDQLSIIAGSNLMSIARGKIASIDTGNSKVTLEDPNNRGACSFAVNDFFWIKAIDIEGTLFSDCRGQITDVTGLVLTLNFGVAGANGAITDIAVGDVIVQRGNSTESDRQALIYTTVSDADAPFERIMINTDSLADFTNLDNVVYQHGDLSNLASHDIVPASPGFGVYSNNVYLSGTIHSYDGIIGAWTINSTTITGGDATLDSTGVLTLGTGDDVAILSAVDETYRLWIGDATAADAEFSVTKEGALTAKGVVELGTATQSYSGHFFNFAVKGADIFEPSFENDGGNIYVNRIGFNEGTDYFRTFTICNGKENMLADFVGAEDKIYFYSDDVYVQNDLEIDGVLNADGDVNFSDSADIDFGANHTVIASTSDDTCAVAISDIIGFTTSFTPKGNKIFVSFSVPIHNTTANQQFNMYIYKDAVNHYNIAYYIASTVLVACGSTVIDVTPGTTYTIKLRWSGTTAVQYLGSTGTYGLGQMCVVDLY